MLDRVVGQFLVVRRDDDERDAELLEDRPPLRRGRGEDERLYRFRAFQISSDGQRCAQARLTHS